MTHSLPRHGEDPEADASPVPVMAAGQQVPIDCTADEAKQFLANLEVAVKDGSNTKPIPVVLPTLNDKEKTYISGAITWRFLFRLGETFGAFRLKFDHDGNWFDVIFDLRPGGVFTATRVVERRFPVA